MQQCCKNIFLCFDCGIVKLLYICVTKQKNMNTQPVKHTSYFLINEKGDLEMVSYSPDQDYSGRRDSDQYTLSQGLFIDDISHDLWLDSVKCHRVVGTPSGLQTVNDLNCKIIAKRTFYWDMSKPIGQRQSDLKKSSKWDELFAIYKNPAKKP